MSENTPDAKPEMKRFNVAIPLEQYDRLVGEHRFELRMDRPEFFQHVFNTYEAGLDR